MLDNSVLPSLLVIPVVIDISDAGGGGERVLWTAIQSLQEDHRNVISIVYGFSDEEAPDKMQKLELVKVV